jgi:protein TonB
MNQLFITTLLLVATLSACAQRGDVLAEQSATPKMAAAESEKVYTYVEQMPQLPGGGGQQAIGMELLKRLMRQPLPSIDLRQQYSGSAMVYFEVNSTGTVQHVKLLRATGSASVDSALVIVTKKLPRFTPGYQNGKPVTVSFTMPFSCIKPQ